MDKKIEIKYFTFYLIVALVLLVSFIELINLISLTCMRGGSEIGAPLGRIMLIVYQLGIYVLLVIFGLISWATEAILYSTKILNHFSHKISEKTFLIIIFLLVFVPIITIVLPTSIEILLSNPEPVIETRYTQSYPQSIPEDTQTFYQETIPEVKKVPKMESPKPIIKNEDIKFEVNLGRCRMITSRWNPPYVDEVHNTTLEVRITSSGSYDIIMKESSGNKEFDDSTIAPVESMMKEIARSIPKGQAGHTFLTFTSCPRFKVVMSD